MKNIIELRSDVNNYKDGKVEIIYIQRIGKKNYDYIAYAPTLNRKVEKQIKSDVFENLELALSDREVVEFDPVLNEVNTIEMIPGNEVENLVKIETILSDLKSKSISEIDFDNIWGYAIIINKEDGSKLTLFRKYAYPKVLKQGRIWTLVDGHMDILDKKIISIDSQIDCIYIDDQVYVLNKYYFESFFNFSQAYKDVVNASLGDIEKLDIIDNLDSFSQRCLKSDRLTKQLVKLVNGNKFEWIKNNRTKLKQVKMAYKLSITIDSNNKIIYTQDDKIKDIIDLISGNCGINAIDNSKRVVKGISKVLN